MNLKLISVKKIHRRRIANNMKSLFLVLILFNVKSFAQSCKPALGNLAAIASTACTNDSLEMVAKLKNQSFRCDSFSETSLKRGILCVGKISPYSQAVRVYVSPKFKKKSDTTINLHLHGHRLNGIDTFQTLGNDTNGVGDYGARLVESGSTDLLVIPESTGSCLNYDTELTNPVKMKEFLSTLEKTTGLDKPSYRLSSHSGGARSLNKILLAGSFDGRVKSIGLFDAIYQEQKGVIKFLEASPKNKVTVAYLAGGTTQNQTAGFLSSTQNMKNQVQVFPFSKAKSTHMNIMNQGQFSKFLAE